MIKISPSILAADFANLEDEIKRLGKSADLLHLDIMDGQFVPNISFGIPVVSAIKKITQIPLDVHLMIENPENFIDQFADSGAEIITVHYEGNNHLHRLLEQIRNKGCIPFVSINPHTTVEVLEDILPVADGVLVMSVNPGFGGQIFIRNTLKKIERLNKIKKGKGLDFEISVDGGVNSENAVELVRAGATILVAGSFIFKNKNPQQTILELKESLIKELQGDKNY